MKKKHPTPQDEQVIKSMQNHPNCTKKAIREFLKVSAPVLENMLNEIALKEKDEEIERLRRNQNPGIVDFPQEKKRKEG